jgi:hypothetical protein
VLCIKLCNIMCQRKINVTFHANWQSSLSSLRRTQSTWYILVKSQIVTGREIVFTLLANTPTSDASIWLWSLRVQFKAVQRYSCWTERWDEIWNAVLRNTNYDVTFAGRKHWTCERRHAQLIVSRPTSSQSQIAVILCFICTYLFCKEFALIPWLNAEKVMKTHAKNQCEMGGRERWIPDKTTI